MSKAYDRMKWAFLVGVMLKLGFHPHFVQMVMFCISTVSYSLLLNGSPASFSEYPSRESFIPIFIYCIQRDFHSWFNKLSLMDLLKAFNLQRRLHLLPIYPSQMIFWFLDEQLYLKLGNWRKIYTSMNMLMNNKLILINQK